MPGSDYQLVTRWTFAAPLPAVWEELMHPERWQEWWRGVRRVELLERGAESGVGARRRMTWRSALPYELTFDMRTTRIEPRSLIEGVAEGELHGRGIWTLAAEAGGTHVRYDWRVEATRPWMRLLAPVAKPLFAWNHGVVMEWGRAGLAKKLAGARPAAGSGDG
jgi:uncharacterized protein YndB with AHSA1/START domain